MQTIVVFVVLAFMGGLLWWLAKGNRQRLADMASILQLQVISKGTQENAVHPVLGKYRQTKVAEGSLQGYSVKVWQRSFHRPSPGTGHNRSAFTVLEFVLPNHSFAHLRIEPAMTSKMLAVVTLQSESPVATGDAAFDQTFRVHSSHPQQAFDWLSTDLRQQWLALRKAITSNMPANKLGQFSGDLLMGSLQLEHHRLFYSINGTPSAEIGYHLVQAAPLLAAHAALASKA